MENTAINPKHYKMGNTQVWEQMIRLFGTYQFISFCQLNAFKYRMRAGYKREDINGIAEDINKAKWYETMEAIVRDVYSNDPNISISILIDTIKNHPEYPVK